MTINLADKDIKTRILTLEERNSERIDALEKELNKLSLFVYGKTLTPHGWVVAKHEEIKRIAEQIFVHWNKDGNPKVNPATAWENAEDFYKYAKENQGIDDD